jgi:hypothetical protein
MSDQPPPHTLLSQQALTRLQKLADGNGLTADQIKLLATDEQTYVIKGITKLTPFAETLETPVGAKTTIKLKHKNVGNFAALKSESESTAQQFKTNQEWVPEGLEYLKKLPANGWGLSGDRFALPEYCMQFSATEICPKCRGQKLIHCTMCAGHGLVTCAQCRGNRYEVCNSCGGLGFYQGRQDQPCGACSGGVMMNGLRCVACRVCNGSGQMACPTCGGRRGTACDMCKGIGNITRNITLTCGMETSFIMKAEGLPSGLRRGLDRLGATKLGQGYADIQVVALPQQPEENPEVDDQRTHAEFEAAKDEAKSRDKSVPAELHYEATLPYADMRVDIGGHKAIVSVFGKRGAMLGVPNFLDDATRTARDAMHAFTKSGGDFQPVFALRLMCDARALLLAGKGDAKDLRKLYPYGLSVDAAQGIMREMQPLLNKVTRAIRLIAAVLLGALNAGLLALFYLTPLRTSLAQNMSPLTDIILDIGILAATLSLGWFGLSFSTRLALQRKFPKIPIAVLQKTGKTGYSLLGTTILMFALFLCLSAPAWLRYLASLTFH